MATTDLAVAARLNDARWFPVDLDVARGNVHLLDLDEATVESAPFIDVRLPLEWARAERVPFEAVAGHAVASPPIAWLWHTSFCGSTLLARILHLAPYSVALREPLPLRRLSDARDAGIDIYPAMAAVLPLLARPWRPGGRVVVKPTHAALNVAPDIMSSAPDSRALVLTSSLEDFVLSHFKKTPQTLEQVSPLASRALRAGTFSSRLPEAALDPPDVLCASALQWAAQRELVQDLVESAGSDRVGVLDFDSLLRDPAGTAVASARWLGLPLPEDALRAQATRLSRQHAKVPSRRYGLQERRMEGEILAGHYRHELDRTLDWAQRHLLPSMREGARAPGFVRVPQAGGP